MSKKQNNKPLGVRREQLRLQKSSDIIQFNQSAEKQFLFLAFDLTREINLTPKELIQEASFELDISPETAKRYLVKHSARRASLFVDDSGYIRCKFAPE